MHNVGTRIERNPATSAVDDVHPTPLPVNMSTTLSADVARGLPYGEAVGKLIAVDWDTINANRTAWNNRWTREIER